jgi:acetyl esterase/lipase
LKNNMKRAVLFFLVLIMFLGSMPACGRAEEEIPDVPKEPAVPQEPDLPAEPEEPSQDTPPFSEGEKQTVEQVPPKDDGTTVPDANAKTQRVIYKKVGKIELTMKIERPRSVEAGEETPVLVLFPGGGWRAADISAFAGYNAEAAYLKDRGWTIVVAEYRLRADNGNTDYRHLASNCGLEGMISDCMDVVRYLVKYADILGVDTDAICTGGHSAGGHLALMTALGDPAEFAMDSALTEYAFTIAAATAKSGPTDCASDAMRKSYVPLLFPKGFDAADLTKCSPITYVSADMCPTLIGYGSKDQIFAPSSQWEAFGEKCAAVGAADQKLISQPIDHATTGNAAITSAMQTFLLEQAGY